MLRYTASYHSPLGPITLASDGDSLTGLWFEGQRYYPDALAGESEEKDLPVFRQVKAWLDVYFSGRDPGPVPPVRLLGTDFQRAVWAILATIPYGQTRTYGDIARELGDTSPRAVGNAVGRNPVSILVPCHWVVGSGGSLTGYAGGTERKTALLKLEEA